MSGKRKHIVTLVLGVLALALLFSVGAALAAGGFAIPWWTVDGGGGQSAGGHYSLVGTLGQPEGGTMSAGRYTVAGGFWASPSVKSPPQPGIFLPLVTR